MNGFLVLLFFCALFYCLLSWVLPKVLAWLFERKFKVVLRVGRIAVPYLKVCDVSISKKGFKVQIEEISFKISLFDSQVTKLLTVVIRDVRINKDVGTKGGGDAKETISDSRGLDFRGKKIPHSLSTFAQFMAVHVHNISAMLLGSDSPGWLIHATATGLHLDGSIVQSSQVLFVNANLEDGKARVLRHSEGRSGDEACLGEIGFEISTEALFKAHGPLSFENLNVNVTQTNATIYDGFYSLAQTPKVTNANPNDYYEYYEEGFDFLKIAPVVPKVFVCKIDSTSLRSMRENSRTDFNCTLQSFQLAANIEANSNSTAFPNLGCLVQFNELLLQNSREKILMMSRLKADVKFRNPRLNFILKLNDLTVTYSHETIHKWVYHNFLLRNKSLNLTQSMSNESLVKRKPNIFERMLRNCVLSWTLDMFNVSALLRLNGFKSSLGFRHTKVFLEQADAVKEWTCGTEFLKLLLANRHWHFEAVTESFWWSFNEWVEAPPVPRKIHVWQTPVFIGSALVKLSTYESSGFKMEGLVESLQLEWCSEMSEYVLLAINCFKEYNVNKRNNFKKGDNKIIDVPICVAFAVTNINLFLSTQNEEYFILRLDTWSIEGNPEYAITEFKQFKIFTVSNDDNFFRCSPSEEIASYKAWVKCVQLEARTKDGETELEVNLNEQVVFFWSTNLHLKILTIIREIKEFILDLEENFDVKKPEEKTDLDVMRTDQNINLESSKSQNVNFKVDNINRNAQKRNAEDKTYVVNISAKTDFELNIKISERHHSKICISNISASVTKAQSSLHAIDVKISLDDDQLFTISDINVMRIHDNQMIREERLDNENFQLPWNKTWGWSIGKFAVIFPYEHSYADAVQNELVSVFKWLKVVHGIKKSQFTVDSPLPSDLLININEFLFELSDDPFEVRLRDNFELLEDEYNENLKRSKMLKDRLEELWRTHLHLPAEKVEELYAKLNKKNAEVYIQRSKQMLANSPSRTRLFAWSMSNVQALVLADTSIHGTDNVLGMMREIDPDSPWPEEGMEFSTLWCRVVSLKCDEWKFLLRDYPQPLMKIDKCYICGSLVGAEQVAPRRAKRDALVELGEPWGTQYIERSMLPLKFYHDFNCEIERYSYAFGPCWEPVIAQCNLSFEKISAPSRDPSPVLPFWDKMRLLMHGRLTMVVNQMTVLLHASLDPYNTTEEMELTWNQVVMDWTNAKFVYKGDFNIFVRTASKYDDCQLLRLPNLKLVINIQWVCLGDPNDHHSVIQCAPDKIPEYSSNQVHDSYRAFRSQNVNLSIVLETKPLKNQSPSAAFDIPVVSLYGSTLRWFENLKFILSGVTRPTRRGEIFSNVRPRKIQLSRHYKKVHFLIGLHKLKVCYWMSFAMQRGCEMLGGRLSSSSEHTLSMIPVDDGLKHRPKAEWSIMYMNSDLNDSEIWLKTALQDDWEQEAISLRRPVEKFYCLSVAKVSYGREAVLLNRDATDRNKDTPTHRLVVYDLKGAWTKSNRNVALALFDSFMKTKQMKKNLSTEALKGFRKETTTPLKRRNAEAPGTPPNVQALQSSAAVQDTPSPLSKMQSGHAANMLQQLIAEAENKNIVYSDDLSSATRQQHLQGLQACQEDDIQHKNWQIALVNAQVLLKGCESKGYVILSAAKAEICQRIHRPVWKDRTLVSKTTWVGSLECLQYYATVNAGENDSINDNIMWLTLDNIQEKESTIISEILQIPNIVGSGVSVGAVVSDTVGAASVGNSIQLQRIVSRCKCEFFYVGYGDISVDPATIGEVPPPPQEDVGPWDRRQTTADAFTLMHHDLDVCTNSLQYAMLLDIVNNLLLYVEPHRKEALDKLATMRFKLQLQSIEDQRKPIQNLQTQVRSMHSKLRRVEKEWYFVSRAVAEDPENEELLREMEKLEDNVYECKGLLNVLSEELDMMLSCYKESQLLAHSRLATTRNDKPLTVVRMNEICFKHAQWRLTETDGQLGIADLVLSNFLYTKSSKSDDSVEHLLELGYLRMTNLLKNQIYTEVLCPTQIQSNMPVEHKRVVRVFCREKPPVGGISVKEHFEINVVPLTIGLTKKFYNTMMKFCFPERQEEAERPEGDSGLSASSVSLDNDFNSKNKKIRSSGRRKCDSNFYVPIDDIAKMKERAEKNKLFIYIKIPEVPVRLSYKGTKEKNLEDIRDFHLVIPTLEYHNVTWRWVDLLMAIRTDSKRVLLSQAIKQKLQIKKNIGSLDDSSSPHEEDKAKILFGNRQSVENKSQRKGMFKFGK